MRTPVFAALFAVATICCVFQSFLRADANADKHGQSLEQDQNQNQNHYQKQSSNYQSRQLLFELLNCSPAAVDEFPQDVFTHQQRLQGALTLHFIGALYMFLALAIVCDEYFVPSLEVLCYKLKLQDDVAGATFMAGGSSAPDLAAALIGVFIAKNDVGLGAIVGSAVFNVLLVPGVCGLAAGTVLYLNWWPLMRDSFYYAISITALAATISDGFIRWYEALIILLIYVVYIVLMKFNSAIERWMLSHCTCLKVPQEWYEQHPLRTPMGNQMPITNSEVVSNNGSVADTSEYSKPADQVPSQLSHESGLSEQNLVRKNSQLHQGAAVDPYGSSGAHPACFSEIANTDIDTGITVTVFPIEEPSKQGEKHLRVTEVFKLPRSCFKRFIYFLGLPITTLLFLSVPDCRVARFRNYFWLTFIMATLWIALFAYLMVWMIVVIGATLNISDSLMGITFVAFGASLSDLITSYLVARDGRGDMAICNAIGSNVFDILVCLGIPWLLKTLIDSEARANGIPVYSKGLLYSTLTLLLTVLVFVVVSGLNRWRMDKKFGFILLLMYVVFMVVASLYEMNVFGYVNPPQCTASAWV